MMKRNVIWMMVFLIVGILTACNNEENELIVRENVVLSAGIDNNTNSRVVLGDDMGTNSDVYWSDDKSDAISIEVNGIPYTFQKTEETVNSISAKFECSDVNLPDLTVGTFTAKYPAKAITSYASQEGTKEFLKNYHYMEAEFTVSEGDTWQTLPKLIFSTKVAIVKLTLSNDEFKEKDVTNVALKAGGAAVVTASNTFTGTADGNIVVYFALQPATLSDITLIATCEGSDYEATLSGNTLVGGKLYRVVKKMTKVKQFTDLSPLMEGQTNKYKTANCYIVTGAGNYKFRATHMGNSHADEHALTVDHVAVLWETFGTSTTPSVGDLVKDATYADGYISFTASEKKGNALIAAYNSSNEIVWSWHIWMTDQPQEHQYVNNSGQVVGTMMDRNLGATSATPSDGVATYGLFYQWGRKDPFMGAAVTTGYSQKGKAASTTDTWTFTGNTSSTGTIAFSIKNPTYFLGNTTSSASDWCWTSQGALWAETKTIYDPSPYGWQVPVYKAAGGIWSDNFSTYTVDETNKGVVITNNGNAIWYPFAGTLGGNQYGPGYGGLNVVGSLGYYHTTLNGNKYYAYVCDKTNVLSITGSTTNKGSGNLVRCVKE